MSVKKQNFASSVELAGIQVHAAPPRGVYCLYTSTRGGANADFNWKYKYARRSRATFLEQVSTPGGAGHLATQGKYVSTMYQRSAPCTKSM